MHTANDGIAANSMARGRDWVATFLFMAVMVMIGMNALLFASKAANPLITSDAWYFVDTMLRQIPAGTFGIDDLFAKRSGLDHSQPLKRLILLFHYRYFDLDFTIEAVVSVMVAFVNLALFWRISRSGVVSGIAEDKRSLVVFAALSAVYLSLNASMVFSWSLVTMTYTTHTFILLFMMAAWHALQDQRFRSLALLFAAALLLNMVGDIMGAVSTVAILVPVALVSWREGTLRRGLRVSGTAVLACIVYHAGYWLIGPATTGITKTARIGIAERLGQLLSQADQAWEWLVIPLSGSVAYFDQLAWFGDHAMTVAIVLAMALAICHVWFWWQAWKGRQNLASFVAIALMLLFYGLVAAILVTRVGTQGSGFLLQMRYTLIYQWNVVALLLMALSQHALRRSASPAVSSQPSRQASRTIAVVAASFLLLLQVPLSLSSWGSIRYTSVFVQKMAMQMGQLADDPNTVPKDCMPILTVCNLQPADRAELMRFLRKNQLNVFSPAFRARNRLYPNLESVPTP